MKLRRHLSRGLCCLPTEAVFLAGADAFPADSDDRDGRRLPAAGPAQQRNDTEQAKLDDFGEVRDFVDQFFRDINQIGDPNSRIFDLSGGTWSPALASPVINDNRFAIGLVKIDSNAIQFETSVNGISTVQSISTWLTALELVRSVCNAARPPK